MCRVMKLNRSGFYAWLNKPKSDRTIEDNRLLKIIKEFYVASGALMAVLGTTKIYARLVKNAVLTVLQR